MKVRIKKLHPDAVIPKYATQGAAGFDLVAIEDVKIEPGHTSLVKTGLSVEIPRGYELQVRPRSGNSLKTKLRVANTPGTVDSDYRGEVCVIVDNVAAYFPPNGGSLDIKKGDRIAQGVICPIFQAEFEEVEDLSSTARGAGGFGSTGK
jgi:dUTP pyrophosphatase